MSELKPCPVCQLDSKVEDLGGGPNVECSRCGNFKIGDVAAGLLEKLTPQQAANLSGWISEHAGCVLNSTDVVSLLNLRTPSVAEKADNLLAYLARAYPKPGGSLNVNDHSRPLKNLPSYGRTLYGVAWCQDQQEIYYILHNYLIAEKNFVGRDGLEYQVEYYTKFLGVYYETNPMSPEGKNMRIKELILY